MAEKTPQLDTTIEVVTPENIAFRYRVAGPFRRLLAYLIDLLIRISILVATAWIVGLMFATIGLAGFGFGLWLILLFILSWFYGGILETYWNGQTVGKRALGIRVVSTDGRPIDALQAVMRNVLREVDALTVFVWPIGPMIPLPTYLFGLLAVSMNLRFQRLGDLACGTIVVMDERSWLTSLVRIDDPAAIELAASLPPSFEISRTLREALAGYVERRRYFPPGRRADITRHVGVPLCRRLNLPPETSHDLLLCALYYRTFVVSEQDDADLQSLGGGRGGSPTARGTSRMAGVR